MTYGFDICPDPTHNEWTNVRLHHTNEMHAVIGLTENKSEWFVELRDYNGTLARIVTEHAPLLSVAISRAKKALTLWAEQQQEDHAYATGEVILPNPTDS